MDLSQGSLHALKYAVGLANQMGAGLTMMWVDDQIGELNLYKGSKINYRKDDRKNFDELVREYSPLMGKGKLDYKLKHGKVYKEIAFYAGQNDIDLVIVGSHGVSGFEQYWIGSNAYRIVTHAPCPVISVRCSFTADKPLKRIVFPVDNTGSTSQKSDSVSRLAAACGAEVLVLQLYKTNLKTIRRKVDEYTHKAEASFRNADVAYSVHCLETHNPTSSIMSFARKMKADLIAIMTEQDTSEANVMMGTIAQQLVNHSEWPVLSVQSK